MKNLFKIILLSLSLLLSINSFSQTNIGKFDRIQIKFPPQTTGGEKVLMWDSIKGEIKQTTLNVSNPLITAGPITQIPSIGFNPGTNLSASDWINKTYYPFVHASVSLYGDNLYEVGTSNNCTLSFSITARSETVFASGHTDRTFPTPQTAIKSWGSGNSSQTINTTFHPIQGTNDSLRKTFVAFELVGGNGSPETVQSSIVTLSSCYPYFYGMNSSDLSSGGSGFYSAFSSTRIVKNCSSSTNINYNSSTLQYAYFAFPATCPDITVIKDQNNYDWTNSFTKTTVNVTGTGWSNVSYKIYKSNNKFSTVGTWQFIFTQ